LFSYANPGPRCDCPGLSYLAPLGPYGRVHDEVVEYTLSRAASPAIVAEYQTRLPDRKLLQAKLHEFYKLAQEQAGLPAADGPLRKNGRLKRRKKR
jgi:hypothetical protein